MLSYVFVKNLFCFVCSYITAGKRNMESKVGYTGIPPSNATPAFLPQYATTDPATGQAPYGQPPAGYPPQPGYGAPQYVASQPLQPQHQVVVVSAGPHQHPTNLQQVSSFVGHVIFACVVFWCCNWLFGLIAFILAS